MGLIRGLRITQRAMERAILGVSLRDEIRNEKILRRYSSASRKAEVEMGRAHSSGNRWTLGNSSGIATPQRLCADLMNVDRDRGQNSSADSSKTSFKA
ncbi:jg20813 [Pararge aegeria aegeria]|uniref:Jg20813 protein n=1 Tax=Pararge aegeria aegeria TaxID=348720 RepID=A0A8S4R9J5_9NEOP|nr:jg20813 [Pararge aegeria aegeria]